MKKRKCHHIVISDELYNYLSGQRNIECKTYEDVIWRFIKDEN